MRAVCVFQQRLSPVTFCTRQPTSYRRMTPTRGLLLRERTPRRFPVSLFPPTLRPSTFQGLCFTAQNSPLFNSPPARPPLLPFKLARISVFLEVFESPNFEKKNPIKKKNRQILS